MAATSALVPSAAPLITPILQASVQGAVASCNGGAGGPWSQPGVCGTKWTLGGWDGSQGVGQQMGALEVVQAGLMGMRPLPNRMAAARRRVKRAFRA